MGDIILGAKRAPRSRTVARRIAVAVGIVALTLTITYIAFRRVTTYPVPHGATPAGDVAAEDGRLVFAGSSLERAGGLWVLRLSGEPYPMGVAEGKLLGELAAGDAVADAAITGKNPPTGLAGTVHDMELRWRHRLLADGVPGALRAELGGLAAGLHGDYQRLVWRQAALDVGSLDGGGLGGLATGLAFALAGAPPLGHVVVGRSFGLGPLGPPGEVVVSFVRPQGGIPFARVGWAGQVGAVTGINAEAIAVAVNPVVSQDVHHGVAAEPVALLGRDVLERAHTLEEAVSIVQHATPLGSASILIADGKSGAWALVERTPSKTVVLKPKTPPVAGDFLASPEFAKDADNDRARRMRGGGARWERLVELLGRAVAADPTSIAGVLRDRRAKGDARLPLGNGAGIDDVDQAHVAVIDATSMTLWVGEGPGAAGPLRAFDLRHELLDEPPRAGTSAQIAADPTVDLAAARDVLLARRALRAAEEHWRHGRRAQAAEQTARALALAPQLADAHRLAGDLARARGDETAAAEHYRRFLALAPSDRAAEEDVRAYLGKP